MISSLEYIQPPLFLLADAPMFTSLQRTRTLLIDLDSMSCLSSIDAASEGKIPSFSDGSNSFTSLEGLSMIIMNDVLIPFGITVMAIFGRF